VFTRQVSPMNYADQARNMDTLAAQLQQSNKVT
jgi:hypothetical protein